MAEVSSLSADELISELRKFGLNVGPITPTTRKLFEKKLLKARGQEKRVPDCEEICVLSSTKENDDHDTTDSGVSISNQNIVDTSTSNSAVFHYGVSFDRCNNDGNKNTEPAVFSSKQQALQAVKQLKSKGARFKAFKTREEAERFSLSSVSSISCSPGPVQKPVDPVGNFKKPTPQELIQFRKIIESGNFQEFLSIVNNNPKYLISSGDTPVVLQEGFRYNALHIAAKENKAGICKLIVDTVESDRFWIHYLSLHKDLKLSPIHYRRKQFLADLYLNTPDKGNFETPLHFACKYGHVDVVKYLVSHPLTDISRKNKYGDTPGQIICSRCSSQTGSVKIMEEIKHILEDSYYVPVFGSEGDASPPSIGEPWSPDVHCRDYRPPSGTHSPVDPKMTVRAYAGPMSPSKASEFHRQWKTPPKSLDEKRKYDDIRRGDSTRGLERIGRNLAHAQNIPWSEYWGFLGMYADLSKPSGLECLEEYFNKQLYKANTIDDRQDSRHLLSTPQPPNDKYFSIRNTDNEFRTPPRTESNSSSVFLSEDKAYYNIKHNCSSSSSSSQTYPIASTSQTSSDTVDNTCDLFGKLSIETSLPSSKQLPGSTLNNSERQENLDQQTSDNKTSLDNIKSPDEEDKLFLCKTNLLDQLKDLCIEDETEVSTNTCDLHENNALEKEKEKQHEQQNGCSLSARTMSNQSQNMERKSSSDINDMIYRDRREMVSLFINGCYPSKTDLDVLRALDGVSISYDAYPLLTQWRDRVTSYTSSARESWPSPGSPLCRSRQKSMF